MLLIEPFILAYIRVYYCIVKKESVKKVNGLFDFQTCTSVNMSGEPSRDPLYPNPGIACKNICFL